MVRKRLHAPQIALVSVLLLSLAAFVERGLIDAARDFKDFAVPYLQARAWVFGGNPYDWEVLRAIAPANLPTPPGDWLLYPPSSFALTAPLGALPWEAAWLIWLALSVLLYLAMVAAVGRWAGAFATPAQTTIFVAGALAMYGAHTGIGHGQPAIPAGSLLVLALYAEGAERRPLAAAVLAALAFCLKPNVGGAALAYFFFRRRWRALFWAVGFSAVIVSASVLPLASDLHAWWAGYWDLQSAMLTFGGGRAPGAAADLSLVDLNNLLRFVDLTSEQRWLIRGIVTLALLGLWLSVFARNGTREDDLIAVPPFLCLILLAVYHRTYDLIILLPLFGWLVAAWPREPGWRMLPPTLALAPLMQPLPTATLVALWHFQHVQPHSYAGKPLFEILVLPHVTWILLFLCAFQCVSAWMATRSSPGATPPPNGGQA